MATEVFIIDVRTRGTKRSAADVKRIGTSASQVRKTLAFLRAALVAVAAVRIFARLTSDLVAFSDEMLVVKAVTGATALEFERLREVAKGLGATTRFTAAEAAEGMSFLARAGFEVGEVIGSIPAVLDLAAAAQLDLGRAADIASNLMTSFGLSVSDMPEIMDTLVFTANNANTTVQQLADGLKLFAPIASQLGISLKDAAASMAILGDAGIQSSLAGTGLRRVITDLEAPTGTLAKALKFMGISFESVRPSSVGLAKALQVLKDANVGASATSLLFGKRGGFIAAQLIRALDATGEFREELERIEGVARKAALVMEQGLGGALRLVRSAFQNLLISFADLGGEDFLNQFFRDFAEGLRAVARHADDVTAAVKVLLGVLVARKLLLFAKASIIAAVNLARMGAAALASGAKMGVAAAAARTLKVALLGIPFVAILTSIGLLITGFVAFRDEMKLVGDSGGTLNDVFVTLGDYFEDQLLAALSAAGLEFDNFGAVAESVSSRVASGIEGISAAMVGLIEASKVAFNHLKLAFLEAKAFVIRQGTNLIGIPGLELDLNRGTTAAQKLADAIRGAQMELATGRTMEEAFFLSANEFGNTVDKNIRIRLTAERDAAIIATEEANRAASKARVAAAEAAAKRALPSTGGRTDLTGLNDGDDSSKNKVTFATILADLERETTLLKLNSREREIRNELFRIEDSLKRMLTPTEEAQVKALLESNQKLADQAAILQEILGPLEAYNTGLAATNALLGRTAISSEQAADKIRDLRIALLETRTDTASGIERALLKAERDFADFASTSEALITDAFAGAEDAMVKFFETGKFEMDDFFRTLAANLIKLGTQQLFSGLQGGTNQGGSSFGFFGDLLGGIDFGSLFGFHEGGGFTVGANSAAAALPGIDNRLIAFRAQDGEKVTITPKNQEVSGPVAGPITTIFNVSTPDADSFQRSKSQIGTLASSAIDRARMRR